MKRLCEKHGVRMSLWERDRCGDTWMCGKCLMEVGRELSRDYVIEQLEALLYTRRDGDPLIGRTLNVPDNLVKLALRQLRGASG